MRLERDRGDGDERQPGAAAEVAPRSCAKITQTEEQQRHGDEPDLDTGSPAAHNGEDGSDHRCDHRQGHVGPPSAALRSMHAVAHQLLNWVAPTAIDELSQQTTVE
jgi:hypothetical protein